MGILNGWLNRQYNGAARLNIAHIGELLESNPDAHYLDLGCDDGVLSTQWADRIGTRHRYGVEIVEERAALSRSRGLDVRAADLNRELPFAAGSIDVVTANQVIEHLFDSDRLLSEMHRILRPGGYAVVSTENASSWCNIAASLLGWQMFSLTNFSNRALGIGNPLALHRGEQLSISTWAHVRIYNIRGFKEYFEVFGFRVERLLGSGYFPLPSRWGEWDVTHAHFITLKARRMSDSTTGSVQRRPDFPAPVAPA